MGLIIDATKCTNAYPANASRNLYSAHPTFHRVTNTLTDKMMSTISKVIKLQNIKGNIRRYSSSLFHVDFMRAFSKTRFVSPFQT